MNIAVIPARGGSKRIPKKNIRKFCGKPIIAYSIEVAIKSGVFDEVIVSTDDSNIAEVASKFGAAVPFVRPPEFSDDYTGTNAVIKHAVQWYLARDHFVDNVCCLYATAPFVQVQYLQQGYELLKRTGKSFAFSVTTFPFPIQRALRINKLGLVEPIKPENITQRSQDLEECYHDAGQFYWGRAEAFLNDIVTYSTESVPVVIPRYLVQDIDTEEDWFRAELMYKAMTVEQNKLLEQIAE